MVGFSRRAAGRAACRSSCRKRPGRSRSTCACARASGAAPWAPPSRRRARRPGTRRQAAPHHRPPANFTHYQPGPRPGRAPSTAPPGPPEADPDPGPRLRHRGLRAPAHKTSCMRAGEGGSAEASSPTSMTLSAEEASEFELSALAAGLDALAGRAFFCGGGGGSAAASAPGRLIWPSAPPASAAGEGRFREWLRGLCCRAGAARPT